MKKEGMFTALSIPEHKVLDRGLLRALIRDAYISIKKFNQLLKSCVSYRLAKRLIPIGDKTVRFQGVRG